MADSDFAFATFLQAGESCKRQLEEDSKLARALQNAEHNSAQKRRRLDDEALARSLHAEEKKRFEDEKLSQELARKLQDGEDKNKKTALKVEIHTHNVLVFRNVFNDDGQRLMMQDILQNPKVQAELMQYGMSQEVQNTLYELSDNLYEQFKKENADAIAKANRKYPHVTLNDKFEIDTTYAVFYPRHQVTQNGLHCHWHTDGDVGDTFILTLGGTTEFLTGKIFLKHQHPTSVIIAPSESDINKIILRSGDAVLFPGRFLQHAVGKIHDDAPEWFRLLAPEGKKRLALMMRQTPMPRHRYECVGA